MKVRALPAYYSPTGFQKLTVAATSVGFTLPTTTQTRAVIFNVEDAQCRMKVDGNAPTTTDGLLLYVGDIVEITNVDMINNFRAIRTGASSSTLQIHYFGGGV